MPVSVTQHGDYNRRFPLTLRTKLAKMPATFPAMKRNIGFFTGMFAACIAGAVIIQVIAKAAFTDFDTRSFGALLLAAFIVSLIQTWRRSNRAPIPPMAQKEPSSEKPREVDFVKIALICVAVIFWAIVLTCMIMQA